MATLREPEQTGDYLPDRVHEYVFHQDLRRSLGGGPLPQLQVDALELTPAQLAWADDLLEQVWRQHPDDWHRHDWDREIGAEFGPRASYEEFRRWRNRK